MTTTIIQPTSLTSFVFLSEATQRKSGAFAGCASFYSCVTSDHNFGSLKPHQKSRSFTFL